MEGGKDDPRFPGSDRRYANNRPEDIPLTESLKTTVDRFMPLWIDTIAPAVKSGKNVIIAAHGNSLRVCVTTLYTMLAASAYLLLVLLDGNKLCNRWHTWQAELVKAAAQSRFSSIFTRFSVRYEAALAQHTRVATALYCDRHC